MTTAKKKTLGINFPPYAVEVCKGAEEIAEVIKEDKNKIPFLVRDEKLPAWKRDGSGPWRALKVDLFNWLISQSRKYKGNAAQDAEAEL